MNNIVVLNFLLIILNIFHSNYAIFKLTNGSTDDNVNTYRTYSDYRANMQLHTVKIFARENSKTLKGYSCSGSIVDYYWIITSAHCVYGFDVIDVFIGMKIYDIFDISRHGIYDLLEKASVVKILASGVNINESSLKTRKLAEI